MQTWRHASSTEGTVLNKHAAWSMQITADATVMRSACGLNMLKVRCTWAPASTSKSIYVMTARGTPSQAFHQNQTGSSCCLDRPSHCTGQARNIKCCTSTQTLLTCENSGAHAWSCKRSGLVCLLHLCPGHLVPLLMLQYGPLTHQLTLLVVTSYLPSSNMMRRLSARTFRRAAIIPQTSQDTEAFPC